MTIKEYVIIIALLIVILVLSILIINMNMSDNDSTVNSTQVTRETIANNSDDPGSVEVIKNIGNPNGEKIAYVVGVHPLEYQTHDTLVNLLPTLTDLDKCYDIYIINVTEDVGHYGDGSSDNSQGRQNGQNLAYKYVYPQIKDGDYKLAIDVHSNVGAYEFKTFVFSPIKEGIASQYADEVAASCENISYYAPLQAVHF